MRIRGIHGNRLVFMILAIALAVGFLTSVFVRPEPMLTASEDCYGLCSSVTALSPSSATVVFGHEQLEKFRVDVGAGTPGIGVPAGRVAVETRSKILCRIHLRLGDGSCSPAPRALAPGSYTIVAHYYGKKHFFRPSTSGKKTLIVLRHSPVVLRHSSVTGLSLSKATVTYGREQVEKFSLRVSPGAPGIGVPAGRVVVRSRSKILCRIHLHLGNGSCSPAPRALAPGSYPIVAHYYGKKHFFRPSTSGKKTLIVVRH